MENGTGDLTGHLDDLGAVSDRISYQTRDGRFAAVIRQDSAKALRLLPSDSFNVAVTSPPYYWVRDYGYDGQIGHEKTVDHYIDALMEVFNEVHRTLHPEGLFLSEYR